MDRVNSTLKYYIEPFIIVNLLDALQKHSAALALNKFLELNTLDCARSLVTAL